MLFWIVAGTLAALVAALLARPLLAPPSAEAGASPDQAIYRDQLREVDRDLARGVIAAPEAERARVEIARRLLAADRAGPLRLGEAPRRAALVAAGGAALLVVLGTLLLYSALGRPGMGDAPRTERLAQAQALRDARPSQAEAETAALQEFPPPTVEPPEDVAAAIERLRGAALQDELGLEDWALLSALEARLGRYADAARAQAQVVAIRGEAASVEDLVRLADLRVAAAGAVVTEETELILAEIHARDPGNLATQLYMGLLDDQTGRPDLAFPRLRRVVEEAQPGSLHWQLAAGRIADVAALAGVDYQPPAAERTPEDMVEGLASRLASQGGTAEEWARLITSLGVLGETERAAAILGEARNVFADDEGALGALDEAARSAGLSE